jgi:hypothetical protein
LDFFEGLMPHIDTIAVKTRKRARSELTNGVHNITVYAEDTFGNECASETIFFNVEVPEPFPTTLVIASAIAVSVVSVALLVYFKKRKH